MDFIQIIILKIMSTIINDKIIRMDKIIQYYYYVITIKNYLFWIKSEDNN